MHCDCAIFPFTESALPIIRHITLAKQIELCHINSVYTWSGLGLSGMDAALICNYPPVGVPVLGTLTASNENWKTLIIDCDNIGNQYSMLSIEEITHSCLRSGKNILLICAEYKKLTQYLKQLLSDFPDQVKYLSADTSVLYGQFGTPGYAPINIPVIIVGGLVQCCDSLEIILSLKEKFIKDGHNVACITSSNLGLLLGMHSYSFIFDNTDISEAQKALDLNDFVKNIIQMERPDAILIEAPDSMLKYNNIVPNGLGIQTYIVSQSIDPDLCICCFPEDLVANFFVESISHDFQNRYGFPICAVHRSNMVLDSIDILQNQAISYVRTNEPPPLIRNHDEHNSIPIFDVVFHSTNALYSHIIDLIS